ncbi:MAG: hypothetical protein EOP48_22605 [Sphingobacteriales bacterium]|nr:MAG: hypothetical protein EOP48_22605 [Sphingobacteriales bacterium]
MILTKTDYKVLSLFLIFVVGGVWASISYNIVEDISDRKMKMLLIPALIFSGAFSYYAVIIREPKKQILRRILGFLVFSILMMFIFLTSFKGYLLLWNSKVGSQRSVLIMGTVTKLNFPKVKKLLNSYVIEIKPSNGEDLVKLIVPTNNYNVGNDFEMEMTKGSLGILYSF